MIVGIQESMIDYPDKMCVILFTPQCSWSCTNCHNKKSLSRAKPIPRDRVMGYLKNSKPLINHVTISGGEPTECIDLPVLVDEILKLDMSIKLDTNGTHPEVLVKLLPKLSVVAMDIKCSLTDKELYKSITNGTDSDFNNVLKSVEILSDWCKQGGHLIFRTTLLDDRIDKEKTTESIKGYNCTQYVVQTDIIK